MRTFSFSLATRWWFLRRTAVAGCLLATACLGGGCLLRAQEADEPNGADKGASMYGSGERPRLSYSNDRVPQNLLQLATGYEAAYNDNPLGQSTGVHPDEEQSVGMQATVLHETGRFNLHLNYQPYFQFYRENSGYNHFNQTLAGDGTYNFTPHVALRVRDDFMDQTGLYAPPSAELSPTGLGSPATLNATIYTPLNNQRANSTRADVMVEQSEHRTLTLFSAYGTRSFSEGVSQPFGTNTGSAGAEYAWRTSEHTSLGVLGIYDRINLSGTLLPGSAGRMQSASLTPTLGWKPRPTVSVSLFAGPQAIRQEQAHTATSGDTTRPFQMEWTAGGGIVHDSEGTAVMLSVERSITDGGGLLSFVSNLGVTGGVRRRLSRAWDLSLEGGYARNRWIPIDNSSAEIWECNGRVSLVHPLRENMILHIDYQYLEQTPQGSVGLGAEFHRNRIATSISWNWRPIRLGR